MPNYNTEPVYNLIKSLDVIEAMKMITPNS